MARTPHLPPEGTMTNSTPTTDRYAPLGLRVGDIVSYESPLALYRVITAHGDGIVSIDRLELPGLGYMVSEINPELKRATSYRVEHAHIAADGAERITTSIVYPGTPRNGAFEHVTPVEADADDRDSREYRKLGITALVQRVTVVSE